VRQTRERWKTTSQSRSSCKCNGCRLKLRDIARRQGTANKNAIAAKMKEQGADAVLITRIANRKTVYTNLLEVYAPPQSYRTLAELLRVWLWQHYFSQ